MLQILKSFLENIGEGRLVLCFLMPLENASPQPESLPSDIMCCLLLGCSASSSKECVVSHCFQSAQGPFGLGICGRAGSQSMNWALVRGCRNNGFPPFVHQALKLKQPTLSFNNPAVTSSSGISENLHPVRLKGI